VEQEMAELDLGDQRLEKRAQQILKDFFADPGAAIPQACGSKAAAQAAYEFFDNWSVSSEAIVASHGRRALERMAAEPVLLAVQDTTSFNHSHHAQIKGMGPIGTEAKGPQGFFLHTTLALTPQRVPLGVIQAQMWARDPEQTGKSEARRQRPIEEKESYKWMESFQACQRWQAELGGTRMVNIGDREADVYELLESAEGLVGGPYLLIRAEQDRCLSEPTGQHLWSWMEQQPVSGHLKVALKRTPKRAARVATLEVRWAQVPLKPPQGKGRPGRPALMVAAILAQEVGAPIGVEPVCWMLLTNLVVDSSESALEKVEWYCARWEIEVFHGILKGNCKVEERQLETFQRQQRCLTLDLLIAWQIHFLVKQSRQHPDLPASQVFSEDQLQVLYLCVEKKPLPSGEPVSLQQATRLVAKLGGFLARKSDGQPGPKTLGRGLRRLHDMTTGYRTARAHSPP
jgi:hypothetical protein